MAYKIYLSPSDQYGNSYAAGDTNEGYQCNRIAVACQAALERCGFEVRRHENMFTAVKESNSWGADLHIPIHTNAFDGRASGTRIFCYALQNAAGADTAGYKAALAIFDELAPLTPGTSDRITAAPTLYEIRNTNATCTYVEVDFHDVPAIALWIIRNTENIAEAICRGVCRYFGVPYVDKEGEKVEYYIKFGPFDSREMAERAQELLQGAVVEALAAP